MIKLALAGPFNDLLLNKQVLILSALIIAILAQSIGVIYAKQTKRLLHAKIQSLYAARDRTQVEWSQLLLEQGTWQANARVEKVAREKLGMINPDKVTVIVP